ncbi:MAG: peptidoglycan DD-metalloendopeptidase family protein [Oscillospiraceae bacterium]|nr:peptidoglycan DD-metalloendopeptidase family protein [Oscillospiraceae bacterium]
MKNKLIKLIALAAALSAALTFSAVTSADYSDEIEELEDRRYAINRELEDLEYQLSQYKAETEQTEEYLRLYDEKMRKQEEEIDNLRTQISRLGIRISDTEKKIDDKQTEIDSDIEDFKMRLRSMYMQGGGSTASMLVGSTDFYDLLARAELMERISRHDKQMIDDLNYKLDELNREKQSLESDKADLEVKQTESEQVLTELRDTYNNHKETKAFLEAKAEAARDRTWEMQQEQESVEADLAEYIRLQQEENERREREEAERRRREQEEREREEEERRARESYYEDDDDDYSYDDDDGGDSYDTTDYSYLAGSSDLIWPCPTVYNITDGYGWRSIAEEVGSSDFHGGIDINKPGCYGEPIVASASGYVITAGNSGNGFGIHVVIDHGGSLSTLYGHMSSCTVSEGDYVSQGETIGYIGATGYAYGNHCHYEVRVNGERTDPLDYVSY